MRRPALELAEEERSASEEWWETEGAEPFERLYGEKDDSEATLPPHLPSSASRPPGHSLAGIGASPRLRRRFHWPPPHLDPPRTPLLTSTLLAPPLPSPPLRVLLHPESMATLSAHPHDFQYGPKLLKEDAFRLALAEHPNRPWVNSLLRSIKDGFWPSHSGQAPPPPTPSERARWTPSKAEDREVVLAQVLSDIESGWTSEGTDEPIPGVVISGLFVVRREGDKPRVVNDQSASGLNAGTRREDTPAVYDTLVDLIRLLRHLGLDSLPSHAILWKTDVSAAFKALPMHPHWQLRQGIAVEHRQQDGSWRRKYHIEWRGAFGSRATPYLWTSVMGAVLWIVQHRGFVDYPLAYMDDAINVDLSGELVIHVFEGEEELVPKAVGATLDVWDELGYPYRRKKVVFGRKIPIIGLTVDLDALSVSLPSSSIITFAARVDRFLDKRLPHGRSPPLREWRSLVGHASWALTVLPFARPHLTPLYAKLSLGGKSKTLAHAGIFVNLEVTEGLRAIVRGLVEDEPLMLRDQGLTEWTEEDADVVVYTDACLKAQGEEGSGLGFWYSWNGRRIYHYSRPNVRYAKIQFAETFTVAAAVVQILKARLPSLRRLLIRTDSAAAVYAFDGGAADDTKFLPLRSLVTRTFIELRAAKVDLRVLHVSGSDNDLADRLSRAPIYSLKEDYKSHLYAFSPPVAWIGQRRV